MLKKTISAIALATLALGAQAADVVLKVAASAVLGVTAFCMAEWSLRESPCLYWVLVTQQNACLGNWRIRLTGASLVC